MTDAAYWSRTLAWFLVYGRAVTLTYTSRSGAQKTCTGQLLGVGRVGPLIQWQGEKHELCPWSKLIAVEDCREVSDPDRFAGRSNGK